MKKSESTFSCRCHPGIRKVSYLSEKAGDRSSFREQPQDPWTKGRRLSLHQRKVRVQPQILGGGQQNGMRSGTDNVPGIAGLGVAAEMVYTDFDKKYSTFMT